MPDRDIPGAGLSALMPTATEQEAAVLGACIHNGVSWWRQVERTSEQNEILDLFWDPNYRMVATAIHHLSEETAVGDRVNAPSIEDRLSRMPESHTLSPSIKTFLVRLQMSSRIRDLKELLETVNVLSEQRQLRNTLIKMEQIKSGIQSGTFSPNTVSELLRKQSLEGGWSGTVPTFGSLAIESDKRKKAPWTVPTGITAIDEAINGGLEPGRLYVIGARAKVGKSTFVVNMIANALDAGAVVVFVSLEMSFTEVRSRLYACWAGVDQKKIYNILLDKEGAWDQLDQDEKDRLNQAMDEINENPDFRYCEARTASDIVNATLKVKTEYPDGTPIILFVDYLQKLASGSNKNNEIGDITNRFSMTALDTEIAIVVPSQINRSGAEDGMPQPHNLRDSGAIEQDLDVLFLLNRKHLQDENEPKHIMDIWIPLNRTGEAKWLQAFYAPDIMLISDPPEWNTTHDSAEESHSPSQSERKDEESSERVSRLTKVRASSNYRSDYDEDEDEGY